MRKLAAKLVKVMAECSYVAKNGSNDFHHYKYADQCGCFGEGQCGP